MNGHLPRCHFSQDPVPVDPECYCPTGAEEASRLTCGHMPELGCDCFEFEEEW